MITTILSDFANVILHFKKPTFLGSLNGFYRELLNSGKPFNFFDYYEFDKELLDYYKELSDKYSMNIFTTSHIQNDPKSMAVIDELFTHIFSAQDFGLDKTKASAYLYVAEKLGKEPGEILFIDDQQKNVDAAHEAGMKTIKYKNLPQLKSDIDTLLNG